MNDNNNNIEFCWRSLIDDRQRLINHNWNLLSFIEQFFRLLRSSVNGRKLFETFPKMFKVTHRLYLPSVKCSSFVLHSKQNLVNRNFWFCKGQKFERSFRCFLAVTFFFTFYRLILQKKYKRYEIFYIQ